MGVLRTISLAFVCLLFIHSVSAETKNVPGCNGYVVSEVPVDFSKIEIKLLSKERNQKDSVECTPNGYYFIPMYSTGRYILAVTSKGNWNFDPKEVEINFDGVSDPCSKGQDVNFYFKGFNIYGQVGYIGSDGGPSDVTVTLVADLPTEQKEILNGVTGKNGRFKLCPVLPGSYILKATHPRWRLSKSLVTFQIENTNYHIPPKSLLLAGYDVSGLVISDKEPVPHVHFVLLSPSTAKVDIGIIGCNANMSEELLTTAIDGMIAICYVTSNQDGMFMFPSVPSGNYAIAPVYKPSTYVKFDVFPRLVKFSVTSDSVQIKKPFEVSGFSVSGKVLSKSENGKPLANVKIILNGSKASVTDDNGVYFFSEIKSGIYKLEAKADGMLFTEQELKISSASAILPDIYPTSYQVCGNVKMLQEQLNIAVTFVKGDKRVISNLDENMQFCEYLTPGVYNVSIEQLQNEKILWFAPQSQIIEVSDERLSNIEFTQIKAELSGTVVCDSYVASSVAILVYDSENNAVCNLTLEDNGYKCGELFAGFHTVKLVNGDKWCWETQEQKIEILDVMTKIPPFKQIGTLVPLHSSHKTDLKYRVLSANSTLITEDALSVTEGINTFCLPSGDIYEFQPVGCHGYERDTFTWHLRDEPLQLRAISHLVTVLLESNTKAEDICIQVMSSSTEGLKYRIGPLKPYSTSGDKHLYKFDIQALVEEKLSMIPESSSLLFTPNVIDVDYILDCGELKETFIARKGIRFQGVINPPVENVKISIIDERNRIVLSTVTDSNGTYSFKPLQLDQEYRVEAEKEGYVLLGPSSEGVFTAKKLGEISVLIETDTNELLQDVVLSLSGADSYRQISLTGKDGRASFLSLKPGEYYLRPMLKEYKFTPSSKAVKIEEGETVHVSFSSHRALFSVFGKIYSLNRTPEKGAIIEAVNESDEEGHCVQLQEEAVTDSNGEFRIKGLQPKCRYNIHLKKGASENENILQILPASVNVLVDKGDMQGIDFTAISKPTVVDVSVSIDFKDIHVVRQEHFRTLQLKLYKEDGSLVNSYKLTSGTSMHLLQNTLIPMSSLPFDGTTYYVQLSLNTPREVYKYDQTPVYFSTNKSYQLIKLNFTPALKLSESDTKSPYGMAAFLITAALVYWYWESILPVLQMIPCTSFTIPEFLTRYTQKFATKPKEDLTPFMEFEPSLTVVKKKVRARKT